MVKLVSNAALNLILCGYLKPRLKDPPIGQSVVPDDFDEMLERIRDIRASERRVYLRVKEIFTMAADYEPSNKETWISL